MVFLYSLRSKRREPIIEKTNHSIEVKPNKVKKKNTYELAECVSSQWYDCY